MKDLLERLAQARAARREDRESGFSMIELIVVVAIIGILVAVAIPVYGSIQERAKTNQLKNAAANGASAWAAAVAANSSVTPTAALASVASPGDYSLTLTPATGATLENFCVTATANSGDSLHFSGVVAQKSGPNCS